jgi:hypothetical protein
MYRRAMLDRIGGFDEDFFAYADDAELGLRAQIAGWKCLYMPEAVVRHHRGATLGVRSSRRLELIERNRVLLAVKLFPWSLLWLNGVYYAMRLAPERGPRSPAKAKWANIREFAESCAPRWRVEGRLAGAAAAAAHAGQAPRCGTHSKAFAARSSKAHSGTSDFAQAAHAPGRLEMQRIYVIATGGTIEKVYSEQTGNVQNLDSKIDRYFRMLRLPDAEIAVTHLMNKDSLEMTDADRERVLAAVREKLEADAAPVVITHGTDTMVETGLLLQRNLPSCVIPSC